MIKSLMISKTFQNNNWGKHSAKHWPASTETAAAKHLKCIIVISIKDSFLEFLLQQSNTKESDCLPVVFFFPSEWESASRGETKVQVAHQNKSGPRIFTFVFFLPVLEKFERSQHRHGTKTTIKWWQPCYRAPPVVPLWGNDSWSCRCQSAVWQNWLGPSPEHPAEPAPRNQPAVKPHIPWSRLREYESRKQNQSISVEQRFYFMSAWGFFFCVHSFN